MSSRLLILQMMVSIHLFWKVLLEDQIRNFPTLKIQVSIHLFWKVLLEEYPDYQSAEAAICFNPSILESASGSDERDDEDESFEEFQSIYSGKLFLIYWVYFPLQVSIHLFWKVLLEARFMLMGLLDLPGFNPSILESASGRAKKEGDNVSLSLFQSIYSGKCFWKRGLRTK